MSKPLECGSSYLFSPAAVGAGVEHHGAATKGSGRPDQVPRRREVQLQAVIRVMEIDAAVEAKR